MNSLILASASESIKMASKYNGLIGLLGTLFLLVVVVVAVNGAGTKTKKPLKFNKNNAQEYLKKYGYMEESRLRIQSKTTLKKSFKDFQSFFGIPKTGRLDNATMAVMKKPRCGVADKTKRFELANTKWPTKDITYRILNHPEYLSRSAVESEIAGAFRLWSDQTDLTFTPRSSGAVNIAISFRAGDHGDGYPFDGPGNTLAHAFIPQDGTTHFDADERWTINSYQGTSLYVAAAHEFGHALGLGHSSVHGALMFPYLVSFHPNFRLHDDDVRGIQAIYGRKTATTTKGTTTATTTTARTTPRAPTVGCNAQATILTTKNGHTFAVHGQQYRTLNAVGEATGNPRSLQEVYPGLPGDMDAGFTITLSDGNVYTYFFKGAKYWRYSDGLDANYPRDIKAGFIGIPDNVDAAFVYGAFGKIYFFKGNQFWLYEIGRKMDSRYPKSITDNWKNLPTNLDGAVSWNKSVYFIKYSRYYKLNFSDYSVTEVNSPINVCRSRRH